MCKITLLTCALFALCSCSRQGNGESQYTVNIDRVEGLWNITDWERYDDDKITASTFGIVPAGTHNTKYEHFLDLIFYEDGTCKQLYEVLALTLGEEFARLYCTISWNFDAATSTITLVNDNIKEEYNTFATTTLKVLHYNNGEFVLEGLQPTPYNSADTYYRLYGTIGSAKKTIRV